MGESITVSIEGVIPFNVDSYGNIEAIKVMVTDGEFYISFGYLPESLSDELVFKIDNLNPKQGSWQVPQWFIDKRNEVNGEDS